MAKEKSFFIEYFGDFPRDRKETILNLKKGWDENTRIHKTNTRKK